MVTIGIDSHKKTHTFVAVDEVGKKLAERTFKATTDGHLDALEWAERWPDRRWAIEDCRHLTRRLESDLLAGGEAVLRVPTRLMAGERRGNRERGKSDPIDALAVARAALREPDLPVGRLDGAARQLKLLVDHREDLVRERTRMQARLRWHLHELFPALGHPAPSASPQEGLRSARPATRRRRGDSGSHRPELVGGIRELTDRVNALEREITGIVTPLAPTMLALRGCGALSAAKIVGETAGVDRFKSRAAYARWNGTAPIPVWSASTKFRLNRGGNRQVNTALHRIAITQIRHGGAGQAYHQARLAAGDSKTEATRMLRRRLSDEVFRRLLTDQNPAANTHTTDFPAAA